MSWKASCGILLGLVFAAGCSSGESSKSEGEGEHATSPAAQLVRSFYAAANDADGATACGLLTDDGIRTVVQVATRTDCVRTVNGFQGGSFDTGKDELVEIEGVDEGNDGFDVDAVVKGRSEGTYSVVRRNDRLLIDGFKAKEG